MSYFLLKTYDGHGSETLRLWAAADDATIEAVVADVARGLPEEWRYKLTAVPITLDGDWQTFRVRAALEVEATKW